MNYIKRMGHIPAALFTAFVGVAACYGPYNPDCPDIGVIVCPDGSGQSATCTTLDTKTLNRVVDSGAHGITASSGKCKYDCFYWVGEIQVGCGSTTNSWTGSKPDGTEGCRKPST